MEGGVSAVWQFIPTECGDSRCGFEDIWLSLKSTGLRTVSAAGQIHLIIVGVMRMFGVTSTVGDWRYYDLPTDQQVSNIWWHCRVLCMLPSVVIPQFKHRFG